MLRNVRNSCLAALLLMTLAVPVSAKPEVFPPEPADFEEVMDSLWCGFEIGLQIEGKSGGIFFDDRAIITAPGMEAHLTNLSTGSTVSLKIQGTFHDTFLDEAGNVRTLNVGRNLLFGYFDGDPGMFLTVGRVVTDWNVNDLPVNIFDVIESESPGKMIDVCAMLS